MTLTPNPALPFFISRFRSLPLPLLPAKEAWEGEHTGRYRERADNCEERLQSQTSMENEDLLMEKAVRCI